MNGLFDVHTHLSDKKYENEGIQTSEIIKSALENNVLFMCCSGYDIESSKNSLKYATKYKSVYASVAIHPDKASHYNESDLEEIDTLCYGEKVIAVGEIGLDYYHEGFDKEKQFKLFKGQLEISKKHNLPVVLHLRDVEGKIDAYTDALKLLKELKINNGIVHSYTQDYELAKKFINQGFKISFNGIITFDSAKNICNVVEKLSINDIVLETDAPYLSPIPNRGKTNLPHYIVYTAQKIASIKKMTYENVVNITSNNAKTIFNLKF